MENYITTRTQAPSTRIKIYIWIHNVSFRTQICLPTRIRWCPDGITLFRHIILLFVKRLDSTLLHHRIRKSAFSVHTLSDQLGLYLLLLWRADSKISGFDAEFGGCVWTKAVIKEKNLWILKYLNTCGRDIFVTV